MAQKVEWVIKPGNFEKKAFGKRQPGLDLTRATFDILKDQSMIVTSNCCTYFPSAPTVLVVDTTAPTEAELADVPVGGIVILKQADDTTVWTIAIKDTASTVIELGTNV